MTALTPIRAAEAMREAAARLALGDPTSLRQQGHYKTADTQEGIAHRIRSLTPEAVLALPAPTPDEMTAFEAIARATSFNLERRDNGEFFHPITQRVFSVWRAAVRWADEQHQS